MDTGPSERVVTEVADREGVDPASLSPPLYDVVDPEALDALFAPTESTAREGRGSVEFSYCGYDVTVDADGSVTVTERQPYRVESPDQGERA